jgi:UDP-glucose 4-epimerase
VVTVGYSVREKCHGWSVAGGDWRCEGRRRHPPTLIARADRVRSILAWQPRHDDLETIVRTSLNWERQLLNAPWQ